MADAQVRRTEFYTMFTKGTLDCVSTDVHDLIYASAAKLVICSTQEDQGAGEICLVRTRSSDALCVQFFFFEDSGELLTRCVVENNSPLNDLSQRDEVVTFFVEHELSVELHFSSPLLANKFCDHFEQAKKDASIMEAIGQLTAEQAEAAGLCANSIHDSPFNPIDEDFENDSEDNSDIAREFKALDAGEFLAHQEPSDWVDVEAEVTDIPGWDPRVALVQSVNLGEEDETVLYCQRAKILRMRDGDWKELGVGDAKLLRNTTGKVRFLLRQENTGKLCANFNVDHKPPYCQLVPNSGTNKAWVFSAMDISDGSRKSEQFCLKFKSKECADTFQQVFEQVSSPVSRNSYGSGLSSPRQEKATPNFATPSKTAERNERGGLFDEEPDGIFGKKQSGLFDEEPSGIFGKKQSGLFDEEPGGIFGKKQSGLFDEEPSGLFGEKQGGLFGENQGGLFGEKQGGLFGENQGGLFGEKQGGLFGEKQGGLFGENQGGLFGEKQGGLFGEKQGGLFDDVPGGMFNERDVLFDEQGGIFNERDVLFDEENDVFGENCDVFGGTAGGIFSLPYATTGAPIANHPTKAVGSNATAPNTASTSITSSGITGALRAKSDAGHAGLPGEPVAQNNPIYWKCSCGCLWQQLLAQCQSCRRFNPAAMPLTNIIVAAPKVVIPSSGSTCRSELQQDMDIEQLTYRKDFMASKASMQAQLESQAVPSAASAQLNKISDEEARLDMLNRILDDALIKYPKASSEPLPWDFPSLRASNKEIITRVGALEHAVCDAEKKATKSAAQLERLLARVSYLERNPAEKSGFVWELVHSSNMRARAKTGFVAV